LNTSLHIYAKKLSFKENSTGRYGVPEAMGIRAPAEIKFRLILDAVSRDENQLSIKKCATSSAFPEADITTELTKHR